MTGTQILTEIGTVAAASLGALLWLFVFSWLIITAFSSTKSKQIISKTNSDGTTTTETITTEFNSAHRKAARFSIGVILVSICIMIALFLAGAPIQR